MAEKHVNYDEIAATYHQRYLTNPLHGVARTLQDLARETQARRVLEVGCGTGRWLPELRAAGCVVCGLDLSMPMLVQVHQADGLIGLVRGEASRLPFADHSFDLVYCVNALHHFGDQRGFIREAGRVLRSGGALAVIGMDPHAEGQRDGYYLYKYFPEAFEIDLRRFRERETVTGWMAEAGFAQINWRVAERIFAHITGREVLADPFLQKHATSQLALLSDDQYAAGLQRLEAAIAEAERTGQTLAFPVDIPLVLLAGRRE